MDLILLVLVAPTQTEQGFSEDICHTQVTSAETEHHPLPAWDEQAVEQALSCVKRNETITSVKMKHLTKLFKQEMYGCAYMHVCLYVCRCTLDWKLPSRLGWLAVSAGNPPVYQFPLLGLEITGMYHFTRLSFSFLMLFWELSSSPCICKAISIPRSLPNPQDS